MLGTLTLHVIIDMHTFDFTISRAPNVHSHEAFTSRNAVDDVAGNAAVDGASFLK